MVLTIRSITMKKVYLLSFIFGLLFAETSLSQSLRPERDSLLVIQEGTASYYGTAFHKRKTASGEVFDMEEYTAAHKHLPFGSLLKVTNLTNGHEVIVKINDRLPRHSKRVIDLSKRAARQLDMIRAGLAPVKLHALSFGDIEKIRNSFDEIPEGLRLRVYYEPVQRRNDPDIFSAYLLYEGEINWQNLPLFKPRLTG